jgi:acyl-CoA thioesterase-1
MGDDDAGDPVSAVPSGGHPPHGIGASVDLRRRRVMTMVAAAAMATSARAATSVDTLTVCTFGDSVLDCGHYNDHGVHPGQLLVRNDDRLFPSFKGHDLASRGPTELRHRAVDGATVADLARQAARLVAPPGPAVALLTIGGNDLLRGLARDDGTGVRAFGQALERFLRDLPVRPVLLATVYDPTFGDDARNFLGVDAALARANHRRVNAVIADLAPVYGRLVDLHAHFLRGDPSWFVHTIEPSLTGASEVRRAFLQAL